jgi:hypothetical protein
MGQARRRGTKEQRYDHAIALKVIAEEKKLQRRLEAKEENMRSRFSNSNGFPVGSMVLLFAGSNVKRETD